MKPLLADQRDCLRAAFCRLAIRRFARAAGVLAAALMLLFSTAGVPAQAQESAAVARGLGWLQAQPGADGALAGEADAQATALQARSETLLTLRQLGSAPAALAAKVDGDTDDNTEFVARQVIALALSGPAAAPRLAALAGRQNADGGFGNALGFASNPLDTAWVLLAMNAAKASNPDLSNRAVAYLLAAQDASGGYGLAADGMDSYISACVASALQVSPGGNATINALGNLNAWLLARQGVDGSWDNVAQTSSVYLALLGGVSDPALQASVKTYLLARQGADGAWGGDPYATALALRALVAQARPLPTTGNMVLRVVDNASGQAIGGASVVLQGSPVAPAISDATGKLSFSDIPAGNYTGVLGAPGYSARSVSFALQAGTTADLGTLALAVAPTTALLRGVVRDGASGALLRDATVTISGGASASAVTLADGSYSIPGLAPGTLTITVSKTGYASVSASAVAVSGATLVFSPSLALPGQQGDPAGALTGQAVDAATLAPLGGVTVSVGATGKSAVSGSDGRFSVSGIPAGTYAVSFTRTGYADRLYGAVLFAAGSVDDFQTVGLARTLDSVAVQGVVTDLVSGAPIAQASITVAGSTLSARTGADGRYRIEGLAAGAATLRFSASGYASETLAASFPALGEYRLDKTLALDGGANPRIAALSTDLPSYPAWAPVTLQVQVANSAADPVPDAIVDMTIFDPQGQAINLQQAIHLDADGVAQDKFVFPAASSTAVEGKWSTQAYAPGVYQLKARIFTENASTGAKAILAERSTTFTIAPSSNVLRLSVQPLPAFSNFQATEQMSFKVEASHQSNQAVTIPFRYTFKSPAGDVLKQEEGSLTLQPNQMLGAVVLGPFPYQFGASGVYPVLLESTGDLVPQAVAGAVVQVAPGIRVDALQQVAPTTVTPDGDKRIRIQLQLKGVEQK